MKGGARTRKAAPPIAGKVGKVLSKAELLPIVQAHLFAGIPGVCLEIAKALLANREGGVRYELAAPAKDRLDEVEAYMRGRITRGLALLDGHGGQDLTVKATRGGADELVFWLTKKQARQPKKGKPS